MRRKGWSLRTVRGLKPIFARDSVVSPYFYCPGVRRTARGNFAIEGVIGVVHAGFENICAERALDPDGFAVVLDIANLRELSEKSWVEAVSDTEAVEPFCSAMASVLGRLPSTAQSLARAFRENNLYGLPVEKFAGYSHRAKFLAFKEFVEAMLEVDT